MEPYDMVCLSNDRDYFCFPCGTLKLRNEPKPLFNPTIESSIGNENNPTSDENKLASKEKNDEKNLASAEKTVELLLDRLARVAGKMKLELCYSENAPKCEMCKDYI